MNKRIDNEFYMISKNNNFALKIPKIYILTNRQREIVSLLRHGNTQAQCARLLNLSTSTIFNQINEAKERMNCRTVAELVAESMLQGEID